MLKNCTNARFPFPFLCFFLFLLTLLQHLFPSLFGFRFLGSLQWRLQRRSLRIKELYGHKGVIVHSATHQYPKTELANDELKATCNWLWQTKRSFSNCPQKYFLFINNDLEEGRKPKTKPKENCKNCDASFCIIIRFVILKFAPVVLRIRMAALYKWPL